MIVCTKFLEKVTNKPLKNIMIAEKINNEIFSVELDPKMKIEIINKLYSFNEIGTYHNYTSKVMPKYTIKEVEL